ncbi:hypothetical protein WOLCODRAFT_136727 [Wolfiporia cocos MD-104 SS10]|uniref:Uncharacterized protein n=1 Tax=Wolfiporia cocos (strain MD-104) TaxID=742152 RepID=A0A2H3JN25_WOLCO|nr:hypothetical protein WOLCODRAFT_136727 [Wolfiporia cocos MD-104 SS10]
MMSVTVTHHTSVWILDFNSSATSRSLMQQLLHTQRCGAVDPKNLLSDVQPERALLVFREEPISKRPAPHEPPISLKGYPRTPILLPSYIRCHAAARCPL